MRAAIAVVFVLFLTAACGTQTPADQPPERRPASEGSWTSETLRATSGADSPTILATAGNDVLVVTISDEGLLQSNLSLGGEPFRAGEPLPTEVDHPRLAGAVRHDGGWVTVGSGGLVRVDDDDQLLFEPVSLRSDDGLRWTKVAVEGFTAPVDISSVVQSDGVLVAAGAYRDMEDPAMGGFRPMVWRSADGVRWTEVPLAGLAPGEDSYVADLAVSDGRVLAVGRADGHGMVWSSDDAGASWETSTAAAVLGAYAVSRAATQAATAVLSTMEGDEDPAIVRSADRGVSWAVASGQPPARDVEMYAPLWSGGGRFFTVTSRYVAAWTDPEVCYADLTLCQQDSSVTLYASDDGETWSRVDTSGIGSGDAGEVEEAIGTDDGRVVAMKVRGDDVEVHVWPGGTELPTTSEPVVPTVELTPVPDDGLLELGVRYHAPLYVHCGMDWLYLGDRAWRRSDNGPDVETGAGEEPDEAWPIAGQTILGFATLTEGGTVEYSIGDGEVIATYEQVEEQPPGCD